MPWLRYVAPAALVLPLLAPSAASWAQPTEGENGLRPSDFEFDISRLDPSRILWRQLLNPGEEDELLASWRINTFMPVEHDGRPAAVIEWFAAAEGFTPIDTMIVDGERFEAQWRIAPLPDNTMLVATYETDSVAVTSVPPAGSGAESTTSDRSASAFDWAGLPYQFAAMTDLQPGQAFRIVVMDPYLEGAEIEAEIRVHGPFDHDYPNRDGAVSFAVDAVSPLPAETEDDPVHRIRRYYVSEQPPYWTGHEAYHVFADGRRERYYMAEMVAWESDGLESLIDIDEVDPLP